MDDDEQRRLVEAMTRVSNEICKNAKPSDPSRWLLACSRETWAALGCAPEDYDEWQATGVIPTSSLARASRSTSAKIRSHT
jgi:hypothetical protein